jgi:hypothetical protein
MDRRTLAPACAQREFLAAAVELRRRQTELLPAVAEALGRAPYDYWIRGEGRGDAALDAIDRTRDGQWRFHFHGLELDIRHEEDSRGVRIDFGPSGGVAFTPGGVGQFVQNSRPPWRSFPELHEHLAGKLSYDHARCVAVTEALRERGLVDHAAPELLALMLRHRRLTPQGYVLAIPPDEMPRDEVALMLCDRLVITANGELEAGRAGFCGVPK